MKTTEKLAILTALEAAVKEEKAKIREEADDELRDAYLDDGVEKKALKIGDQKVGEFIVTFHKDGFEVVDEDAFNDFMLSNGFGVYVDEIRPEYEATVIRTLWENDPEFAEQAIVSKPRISKGWEDFMVAGPDGLVTFDDTNETVPGVAYVPKRPKGTMVRGCKPKDVMPLVAKLGGVDQLLLGGGE